MDCTLSDSLERRHIYIHTTLPTCLFSPGKGGGAGLIEMELFFLVNIYTPRTQPVARKTALLHHKINLCCILLAQDMQYQYPR